MCMLERVTGKNYRLGDCKEQCVQKKQTHSGILWHRGNSLPPKLPIFRTAKLTFDLARAKGLENIL